MDGPPPSLSLTRQDTSGVSVSVRLPGDRAPLRFEVGELLLVARLKQMVEAECGVAGALQCMQTLQGAPLSDADNVIGARACSRLM
jgi:hypothetical protein